MIKYTVYTENHPRLVGVLDSCLDGYTLQIGVARWQGQSEQSATITYLSNEEHTEYELHALANALSNAIIKACNQNEVWYTIEEIKLHKVARKGENHERSGNNQGVAKG